MPLTKRSLVLPASPPSVKLARSWVSKILAEIGREDLVDAAQLGVSELVTNALIHSQPPLSVRVRGTVVSLDGARDAAWENGYIVAAHVTRSDRELERATIASIRRDPSVLGVIYSTIFTRKATPPPDITNIRLRSGCSTI